MTQLLHMMDLQTELPKQFNIITMVAGLSVADAELNWFSYSRQKQSEDTLLIQESTARQAQIMSV